MKCWVFNEEQLRAALDAWSKRPNSRGSFGRTRRGRVALAIRAFLDSPEAAAAKMTMETKGSPADTLRPS